MKRIAQVATLGAVLVLMASNHNYARAQQDNTIAGIADSLAVSPVYIAPGSESVGSDTTTELRSILTRDDNIVLVMLPSTAVDTLGSPFDIAQSLSESLDNERIIGLAVGTEVVGYAPILPDGLAAEQMDRAAGISNQNPVNALTYYVNYMHAWLAQNPQAKRTPTPVPTPTPEPTPEASPNSSEDGGLPWAGLLGVAGTAALLAGGVIYFRQGRFRQVPVSVQDWLDKIAEKRQLVEDQVYRNTLAETPRLVLKYFQSSSKDKRRDALIFNERLAIVFKSTEYYLSAQADPSLHTSVEAVYEVTTRPAEMFNRDVKRSITLGNAEALRELTEDVNYLQGQIDLGDPDGAFERALLEAENKRDSHS